MKLYLVRHAIATGRDPVLWPSDADRPLTKRGVKRFRKASAGLLSLVSDVDAVLSSPFERAWRTAKILQDAGWPMPSVCEELAQAEPDALIQALQPHADLDSLALVGHESYLSRFAAALLGSPRSPWGELKKGGVVCITLDRLAPDAASEIAWLMRPKQLRALA